MVLQCILQYILVVIGVVYTLIYFVLVCVCVYTQDHARHNVDIRGQLVGVSRLFSLSGLLG